MTTQVRTRFAPSPTGFVHIGSLRTALYCYLFARKNNGVFLLRIEDTDQKRFVEGAVENLLRTFEWAGLNYDEGVFLENGKITQKGAFGSYIQSERTDLYRQHAQILVEKGAAYPCFCTSERLDEMRQKQERLKLAPMYDGACLKLTPDQIEANKKAGIPFVIRQNIPKNQTIKFKDQIRGNVSFDTNTIDHQVLMKSDNFPTYHLANVVDDHLMAITHVIRGEEWLPSTPKHLLLYQAFGWEAPEFAHIPLLLNKDKTKLSKRQGDVSVEDYIKKGYSKEALINFIALLGWHPGSGVQQEIFSIEELSSLFTLEQVHKSGAIFDIEKLDWFNFQWNKKNHTEKLQKIALEIDPKSTITTSPRGELTYTFFTPENDQKFNSARATELFAKVADYIDQAWLQNKDLLNFALITVEEKILKNPREINENIAFYFTLKPLDQNLLISEKMKVDLPTAKKAIEASLLNLKKLQSPANTSEIQTSLLQVVQDLGLKNGQVFWPVRIALTREQFSPGVFEVIWALGLEEAIRRLEDTLKQL